MKSGGEVHNSESGLHAEYALLRLLLSPPGLFVLALTGVAMIVLIADAPLLVAGVGLVSVAVLGALRNAGRFSARGMWIGLVIVGLGLGAYEIRNSGDRIWQKLSLIPQKLAWRGSTKQAQSDRYESQRRLSAQAIALNQRMDELEKQYRYLPEEYPALLNDLQEMVDSVRARPETEQDYFWLVLMRFESIKKNASYYMASHGETAAYKRVFGVGRKEGASK